MKGIDVSSNQHPAGRSIDWHEVADAGYAFCIVKATQGLAYRNPWLERDLDDARAAGLFVGAYHFFEVGDDPTAQAKEFIGALIGQVLDLGAWLDFEPPALQSFMAASYVNQFLAEAKDARPGTGLYADLSQVEELQGANAQLGRLWVASWGDVAPKGCVLWQDATNVSVPGVPAPVDTDVMVNARAFNLPSSPPPRPSSTTARPVRLPAEPGPDGEDEDEDDDSGQVKGKHQKSS